MRVISNPAPMQILSDIISYMIILFICVYEKQTQELTNCVQKKIYFVCEIHKCKRVDVYYVKWFRLLQHEYSLSLIVRAFIYTFKVRFTHAVYAYKMYINFDGCCVTASRILNARTHGACIRVCVVNGRHTPHTYI